MTYTFKTKGSIRLPMTIDHNAVHQRIRDCETVQEKHDLVQATNPFIYGFGKKLQPYKPYESYADNLAKLRLRGV